MSGGVGVGSVKTEKYGGFGDFVEWIMSRQQVAFLKECRKIKGCGILKGDFYTRFIPIFKDFGL